MNKMQDWLKGRKTYFLSAAMFTIALTAVLNDWGAPEMSALAAGIAALSASLRAGVKSGGIAMLFLAVTLTIGGCASLGKVDPATGTTPAQDIVTATAPIGAMLPSPFNAIVPGVVGSVLALLIALGKAKDGEAQ